MGFALCAVVSLEDELQSELQLPHRHGAPDRIDRAERAAAGCRYSSCSRRLPSCSGKVGIGIGKIRRVQQVERFDPKLNVLAAAKLEVLQRRKIDRKHSGSGERGAAKVAKGSERGHLKRGDVEPGGGAGVVQVRADPGDRAGTIVAVRCIRSIDTARHRERESRRRPQHAAKLPPTREEVEHAALRQVLAPGTDRQLVEERRGYPVPNVEDGRPVLALPAITLLWLQLVRPGCEARCRCPWTSTTCRTPTREPVRQPTRELRGQRVVV